ncbi:MAG: PAS domain S-box protein [Isosphaeraceae bacterium]
MSTGTKLGAGFALGMVIIVAIAIQTQVLMQQLSEANRWVVHTHQVLEGLERFVSLLKDAESGQRGFLLTGDGRYLEPYTAASGQIPRELDTLFSLTGDNPAQQESLQRARKLADAKLAELDETIQLRRKSGPEAALQVVRSDRGKLIMDDFQAVANEMETREQKLLEMRRDSVNVVSHRTLLTIALVMPLAWVAIAIAVVVLIRNLRFLGPDPWPVTPGGKWPGIALKYISAAILVAVAAVLRWLGESLGPLPIFITFYPAVLLAAILGGSGPGILATVLSALVTDYFCIPPVGSFHVEHPSDLLALGIFVGTNVSISVLAERLQRARWAEAVSVAQEQELALLDLGNLLSLDPDHRIVRWNEGCHRLYGFDPQEAQGRLADELLQTHVPQPLEQINRTLLEHGYWEGELIRRRKDGTEVVVEILRALRRDAKGGPSAILEVSTDVTQRGRDAQALRESEERFRTMANAIPQLAWIAKPDGYIYWYNQRWYEYTGTTPEQMEGWGWQSVHDPQQLPEVLERWKKSIATGEPFDMIFPLRGLDGVFRPFLTRGMPLKDNQGRVQQWFGTNTDVSEQKQAAEELRESEERFRLLIESVRDYAIFTLDPEGRVTSWNAGAERIKGYRAEEILGQPFTRFYPPEAVGGGLPSRLLQTAAAEGQCEDVGWRVRKDGGRFWADAIVTALRNEAGHLRGFVKITRDMTERKRTEAKILRQTAVLDGINRIFRDALRCVTDEDLGRTCLAVAEGVTASKFGFLGEINPTTGLMDDIAISDPGWEDCRIEPQSGNRRPPLHFQIHGIYGRVLRDGRSLFTNDPESHPDRIGVPPGHPPLTAFLGVPLVRDGQTIGMVGVGNRDGGYSQEELEALEALAPAMVEAFSRNRAEAALHRLNQELDQRVRARTTDLEAANKELEAFSYSVSHDLRAPLRGMDGFSQALLEFYDRQLDAQGRDWLNRIRAGCQRMGQLIDDLLRLSRLTRAEMRCRRVDLTAMAREIAGELRETAPGRSAEFRIAEGLTAVGDPQLLRPALRNLLENAWKFTTKRSAAVIELGQAPAPLPTDPAAAPDPARPHPGETIYFVRDNGAGFDMAYANKHFAPFQRLHSVKDYPGNGIGLALVQRVVHRHGGRIWAEAAPDQGATFYFTLNEPGGEHGA